MTSTDVVVFGQYLDAEDGQLVFLLESTAVEQREAHRAMRTATTWAEFWEHLPDGMREGLMEALEWSDTELPRDNTRFEASRIPGVDDGDFPPCPPAYGTEWLPAEIASAYGVRERSFVSGSWTEVPPVNEEAVVAALRALGYVVRRDDELVSQACGY